MLNDIVIQETKQEVKVQDDVTTQSIDREP